MYSTRRPDDVDAGNVNAPFLAIGSNWIIIIRPMNEFFISGLALGLAGGIKMGPLGVVVVQQTLSRGLPAGVRASLAPLITDGPIILAAFLLFSRLKSIDLLAAAMSLVGGVYLLWLAATMFRIRDISLSGKLRSQGSLAMAVKVSLLSPNAYLFWFTVGGSYVIRGTAVESAVFVVTCILALVASKAAMAVLAWRFLPALESPGYFLAMKILAAGMVSFGLLAIIKGAELGFSGAHRI